MQLSILFFDVLTQMTPTLFLKNLRAIQIENSKNFFIRKFPIFNNYLFLIICILLIYFIIFFLNIYSLYFKFLQNSEQSSDKICKKIGN